MSETEKNVRETKRDVTKQINLVKQLIAEDEADKVTQEVLILKRSFRDYTEANNNHIETLKTDEDIDESDTSYATAQSSYVEALSAAKAYTEQEKSETASTASSKTEDLTRGELLSIINLPKLTLEVFSGNPLQYHTFMAIFDQNVGNHLGDDNAKMSRLLEYTTGEAKDAIRKCALIGGSEGYEKARQILKARFGDQHIVVEKVIDDIRKGKAIKTPAEFQHFSDDLESSYEILVKMKQLPELDTQSAIVEILGRLQQFVQIRWKNRALEMKRQKGHYPGLKEFVEFVAETATELNDPVYGRINGRRAEKDGKRSSAPGQLFQATVGSERQQTSKPQDSDTKGPGKKWQEPPCVLCGEKHRLWYCSQFKEKTPRERLEVVRVNKLCENCLLGNHLVDNCRKASVCSVPGCGMKHTKFLHQVTENNVSKPFNGNTNVNSDVYMPIVPVIVNNNYHTFALLDSASSNTFCVKGVKDKLGMKGKRVNYDISTLSETVSKMSEAVEFEVRGRYSHDTLSVSNVYVIEEIPVKAPPIRVGGYSHLQNIPLVHGPVEILIGQDNAEALIPVEVRKGRVGEPFAVRTMLGWAMNGPAGGAANKKVVSHFISTLPPPMEDCMEQTWRDDDLSDKLGFSVNDKKVLKLWNETCNLVDNHYELPIPWQEDKDFPNNIESVVPRMHNLKRSLQKKGLYDRYNSEIDEILRKGYAEPVPQEQLASKDKTWYLPHQPVITDKKPGKLRVVFDCAAKYHGESLNDKALQGPDLNNKLTHVLLRFRAHPCAFTADVEAMYNQVKVPEADRDALRFLWFDANGTVRHYRMTSHLFGGVWCASAATYALRLAASGEVCQEVQNTINAGFYVDDCLKSVDTKEEAKKLIEDTRTTLAKAGFRLTKFVSHEEGLLDELPDEDVAESVRFTDKNSSKALGIHWDIQSDSFHFDVTEGLDAETTRRKMLSQLAAVYDPLGLVGPVILKGKMLLQEAVRQRLGWDDAVPAKLLEEWNQWASTLADVSDMKIPRCINPSVGADAVLELHHFSDASQNAYGCCSYLRSTNKSGQVHTALIMSKSRVAPLKVLTIPRLELQAAVLAARVDTMLREELHLELTKSYFWVDSEIVLKYIKNEERRFHVFVANRVSAIRRTTEPEQWQHVAGCENPADTISRGCTAREIDLDMWLTGPKFLRAYKSNWQEEELELNLTEDDPEVRKEVISHKATIKETKGLDNPPHVEPGLDTKADMSLKHTTPSWHPMDKLITHYSSWNKLKRAVAWFLKIKQVIQGKIPDGDKQLTIQDLEHSEQAIISHSQSDLRKLISSECKGADVKRLNPYVDEEGIARVGGRIPGMKTTSKNQAIISDSNIARLIIHHFHQIGHLGAEYTLAQIRDKYWVQRKEVKKTLRNCITCKKINGRTCTPKMADLPDTRTAAGKAPFTHTGVDCFGPFSIKRARSMAKRYGCVFTCMTTRAIHIEVLASLDTNSFLNALRRFIARRGQPESITSDNGGNFISGNKELVAGLTEWDQNKIASTLLAKGTTWRFMPPCSSHMGGAWERQIRSIRKVMHGVVQEQTLNDESLATLMCEVEGILNNRPMTPTSDDVNDFKALKPSHLLLLREGPQLPPCLSDANDQYRKQWRQVQYLATLFWKRWIKQYLPELQKRQKWVHQQPNVSAGDLVLLMEEHVPRNLWPLARVVETYPSKDGLVRSVRVKTRGTQLTRPITKLVMLEGKLY